MPSHTLSTPYILQCDFIMLFLTVFVNFVSFLQVNLPVNVLATFPGHGHSQAFNAPDDLPKTPTRTLNQGSSPMSMDFHPVQHTLLLGLSFNMSS